MDVFRNRQRNCGVSKRGVGQTHTEVQTHEYNAKRFDFPGQQLFRSERAEPKQQYKALTQLGLFRHTRSERILVGKPARGF